MIRRIHPYAAGTNMSASETFYTHALGLEVAMRDPVLTLRAPDNPTSQLLILPPGMENPEPSFGIDVGTPAKVDEVHGEAVASGLTIVYPLTNESWGVRRFFMREPGGQVVNILAHQ